LDVNLLLPGVMGEVTYLASATYEDANLFSRITGLITSYRFYEEENVFKFFYSDNGREYYLLFKQTVKTPVTDSPHLEGTSWKLAGAYDVQTDELVKEFEPEDAPHYLFTFIDDTTAYSLPSRSIHLYPGNKVIGSKGTFELWLGDQGLFDDILRVLESYVYDEEKNVFKYFYHSEGREYYLLFKQTEEIPVTDNPHFEGTSWKLAGAYDAQTNELVKEFEPRNHEIFYSFTFYTNTQARGSSASGNELYVYLLGSRVMGELTEMASATYEDANLFSRITGLITSYRFDEKENVFKFFYSDNGREYYLLFKQTES
jgi:hypothetical protein